MKVLEGREETGQGRYITCEEENSVFQWSEKGNGKRIERRGLKRRTKSIKADTDFSLCSVV